MPFAFRRRKKKPHSNSETSNKKPIEPVIKEKLAGRSLVFIGLMGAGKSAIGRRVAKRLDLPFSDADREIETAAGQSVADIFAEHGEAHFRDREEKVIERLLDEGPIVLATGGGAFMSKITRENISKSAVSVWLRAELDVLMERVGRRDHRPLLRTKDPRAVMRTLMEERYPVYQAADVTIESRDVSHETIVDEIINALAKYC